MDRFSNHCVISHHSEEHKHTSLSLPLLHWVHQMNHFCLLSRTWRRSRGAMSKNKKVLCFLRPLYLTRCSALASVLQIGAGKRHHLARAVHWKLLIPPSRALSSAELMSRAHSPRAAAASLNGAATDAARRGVAVIERRRARTCAAPRALHWLSDMTTRFALPPESCLLAQVLKSDAATGKIISRRLILSDFYVVKLILCWVDN